jgi:uncharacterized membrane protein YccC
VPNDASPPQQPAPASRLVARLPLRGVLRLDPAADAWHQSAVSVVVAAGIPNVALLALGRLDLAIYVSAGALCALFAHGMPYAARARVLAGALAGMLTGLAVALVTASVADSLAVRIVVAGLLAAVQKVTSEASRIAPPGRLIFTFVSATCTFLPQELPQVPAHLALALGGGVIAWLVCMAPALVHRQGPQRLAVARALEAAARLSRVPANTPQRERARHAAAAVVQTAWQNLAVVRVRTDSQLAARRALQHLLIRAETAVAADSVGTRRLASSESRLRLWARTLRGRHAVPDVRDDVEERFERIGVDADFALGDWQYARRAIVRGWRQFLRELRPGSPLIAVGVRVAVGSIAAGFVSMAAGVGHPSWAIVTVVAVSQANASRTWTRALQRAVGTFAGLLVFTAITPLTQSHPLVHVLAFLAFLFGIEATVSRNYWLGSACVTSMALLLTTFSQVQPTGELVADRWIDTCVGVAVGVLISVLVTNRRTADRIDDALDEVCRTQADARALMSTEHRAESDLWSVHDHLATALVELRRAVDVATGEWRQRTLPVERIMLAERDGHAALGELVLTIWPTSGDDKC